MMDATTPPANNPLASPPLGSFGPLGHGGGAMGQAVRGFDWAATPLGALSTWPQSLRTLALLVLENKLPAVLAWGPQLTCLYNDAYRPLLGNKPTPLGHPFREVWAEAQDIIDPIIERALAGEASHYEGAAFVLMRNGRPEPAYFDYSFSPVRDDAASVAGFLNVAMETTPRVLAEKHQAFLAALDRALQTLSEPSAVMMVAAGLLGRRALRLWRGRYDRGVLHGRARLDGWLDGQHGRPPPHPGFRAGTHRRIQCRAELCGA